MIEPRLLAVAAAAAYCGITVRSFKQNVPLVPVKIGSNELWDRNTLDAYIDALPGSSLAAKKVNWAARAAEF